MDFNNNVFPVLVSETGKKNAGPGVTHVEFYVKDEKSKVGLGYTRPSLKTQILTKQNSSKIPKTK